MLLKHIQPVFSDRAIASGSSSAARVCSSDEGCRQVNNTLDRKVDGVKSLQGVCPIFNL